MSDNRSNEVHAILNGLSGTPTIFAELLCSIPAELLGKKRGQGFWSLHEHAAHLADVQPMMLERMRRILAEDMAEFVPFMPENDPAAEAALPSVEEIIAQFKSVREEQLEVLINAGDTGWKKRAIHPEYDQYGLFILARHMLMHDHWHLYRMEELWLTKDAYLTRIEG